ncbi:MAG: hypothetical protein IPI64_05610 [Chloracidobacterium sp.]|nr:hypothetical protein [Chloracidobacterium sp.]
MQKLIVALLFLTFLPVLMQSQARTEIAPSAPKPSASEADAPIIVDPPADFVGDGCSMFPDGDYGDCCQAHDRDYFRGGTKAERKASDKRLEQCVRAKGHNFLSKMIYLGVRIGGVPWLPTSFRWGFGQKKN